MKIRQGFVSNSSTTSFCIYGAFLETYVGHGWAECHSDMWSEVKKYNLEIHADQNRGYYIGRSWDTIQDDQTGKQFKESIKEALKEMTGKDQDCQYFERAYYDG
jgi:hypothetical protein